MDYVDMCGSKKWKEGEGSLSLARVQFYQKRPIRHAPSLIILHMRKYVRVERQLNWMRS